MQIADANGLSVKDFRLRFGSKTRMVAVETMSSAELRELASFHADFKMARAFLQQYLRVPDEEKDSSPEQEALWYAAITLYGRAFGNGVRHSAKPSMEAFDDVQKSAHEFVLHIRNKYIAHSVNGFEQSRTWAILDYRGEGKPTVADAGVHHVSLNQLTNEKARLIIGLCDAQIADYLVRIERLTRAVLEECRRMGARAIEKGDDFEEAQFDQTRVAQARSKK